MKSITLFLIIFVYIYPVHNQQLNIFGSALQVCSLDPLTGWTRSGKCEKWANDQGTHLVCSQVTSDFLKYTKGKGNDLSTPTGSFPGLKEGDKWCLCVYRWYQAQRDGHAPPIVLESTNAAAKGYFDRFGLQLTNYSHIFSAPIVSESTNAAAKGNFDRLGLPLTSYSYRFSENVLLNSFVLWSIFWASVFNFCP